MGMRLIHFSCDEPTNLEELTQSWTTQRVNDSDLGSTSHELLLMKFCKTVRQCEDPGSGACLIFRSQPVQTLVTNPSMQNCDPEPKLVTFRIAAFAHHFDLGPTVQLLQSCVDRPRCSLVALHRLGRGL